MSATAPQSFHPPAPPRSEKPLGKIEFIRRVWKNQITTWTQKSFEESVYRIDGLMGKATVVHDTALVKHVLVDNFANYPKDRVQRKVLKPGLGDGLLTAEGEVWKMERRVIAPLFRPKLVDDFMPAIIESSRWLVDRWRAAGADSPVDISAEMSRVTLEVLQRSIFQAGLKRDTGELAGAMSRYFEAVGQLHPFDVIGLPDWLPRFGKPDVSRELRFFNEAIRDIMSERRAAIASGDAGDARDLLSLLLTTRDPQTGELLNDTLVRDNVLTFIAAGHETTSGSLTWAMFLLSQFPDWRREVEEEVDTALDAGAIAIGAKTDDPFAGFAAPGVFDKLVKTRATLEEAMRLYPPGALLLRQAIADDACGEYKLRAGELVVIAPWVLHRHKLLWDRPDEFVPRRFMPGEREKVDRFSYLPFGAGPRVCVGSGFAMREAITILAAIARTFRCDLKAGYPVEPVLRITLRPGGGLPMRLTPRSG